MRISVDFELEYNIKDADHAIYFCRKLAAYARELDEHVPGLELVKETTRQVEENP